MNVILFQSYLIPKIIKKKNLLISKWECHPHSRLVVDHVDDGRLFKSLGRRASENGRCGCVDGESNFPKIRIGG